jgi:hypothetical protein
MNDTIMLAEDDQYDKLMEKQAFRVNAIKGGV